MRRCRLNQTFLAAATLQRFKSYNGSARSSIAHMGVRIDLTAPWRRASAFNTRRFARAFPSYLTFPAPSRRTVTI